MKKSTIFTEIINCLRFVILTLVITSTGWSQCDSTAVELWGNCYSITDTDSLNFCRRWDRSCLSGVVSGDPFTGAIPPEIGKLTNLTHINLFSNELTGPIPEEIGNLTGLTSLNLGNNQLTGAIPSEIGKLTNLKRLYLGENQLTDSIPSEIGSLTNLTHLWLSNNQLTGSIPTEIGNLTNLTALSLFINKLNGEIPESICDIVSNLSYFVISNNEFCPPYPSCVEITVGYQDTTNCSQLSIAPQIIPTSYHLSNPFPNPFNPTTTISYDLPKRSQVTLGIYDLLGKQIKTLVNQSQDAGNKLAMWDGTDNLGRQVSAGVYLYQIQAGEFNQTRKMLLLK